MDTSGSEDEDFITRRCRPLSPVPHSLLLSRDFEESGPVTPPTDYSMNFKNSLGLVLTPQSPPYRKVRSMKLVETPKSLSKTRLEPPAFSSTPAASPCVIKMPRSLKVLRQRNKYDFKDKLNLSIGNVPSSLVNPFSPYRTSTDDRQPKKSRIEKKKIEFDSDDDDDSRDECLQKNLKRPKLSDFDCPKFEKEFMVLGVLGTGDHGCVYRCLHLLTGMEYAVKRSLRPVNNEKVARNEIFAHAALVHPHIVCNYVSWTEDDYVFMQNEYCNGGSLEEHIKKNGPMQEKELMILMEHLAQGLRYIHKCNLAHMDLKPGNIFLKQGPELYYKHQDHHSPDEDSKEETTYKIGDLGHVIKMDNTGYVEDGDCRYLPREMLNESHLDYSKVDIFALGLTLFEAAGGGPLPKNGEEWHAIRDGHIKHFSHLSTQFNNLIRRMINEDPKKRPSACELLDEICRDEVLKERELKAANQKIHLLEHQLSDIVKTVSKSVNANAIRTTYKKRTTNNNNNNSTNNNNNNKVTIPTTERFTRSTSRLVGKKTPKSLSSY